MYCDACHDLFWFKPKEVPRIASRLFKESDANRVHRLIGARPKPPAKPGVCPDCHAEALGTRFATFSYRKALDFPMHSATWRTAERLLRAAQNWVFVGYSMPAADYEFKHLLKRVQLSRLERPMIAVVTGGSAANDTAETYRRFFGRSSVADEDILMNGLDGVALTRLRTLRALN